MASGELVKKSDYDIVPESIRRANAFSGITAARLKAEEHSLIQNEITATMDKLASTTHSAPLPRSAESLGGIIDTLRGDRVAFDRSKRVSPNTNETLGVSERAVAGALASVHPDTHRSVSDIETDLLKSITDTVAKKDHVATQRNYTLLVSHGLDIDAIGTEELELVNYRAQISASAGITDFDTISEAKSWSDQALLNLPLKQRASLVNQLRESLFYLTNPQANGEIILRTPYAREIMHRNRKLGWILESIFDATVEVDYDLDHFDRELEVLMNNLTELLLDRDKLGFASSEQTIFDYLQNLLSLFVKKPEKLHKDPSPEAVAFIGKLALQKFM